MFLLKKILIGQKTVKIAVFCWQFFKPWKSSPKNIICSKASTLPFWRVQLRHMDREKMHTNLPYPNIFTRKKIIHFFGFRNFFLKIKFSFFPVSFLKSLQNWWFSKKSFLLHETSIETWFKYQVKNRKKMYVCRIFLKKSLVGYICMIITGWTMKKS